MDECSIFSFSLLLRILPIFLYIAGCSINWQNPLKEQLAGSIKVNTAHETQPFILEIYPTCKPSYLYKNMYNVCNTQGQKYISTSIHRRFII